MHTMAPPVELEALLPEHFDWEIQAQGRALTLTGSTDGETPTELAPVSPAVNHRPLSHDEFVAKFADPWAGGWLIETDHFVTSAQLQALYHAYVGPEPEPATENDDPTPVSAVWNIDGIDGIDSAWSGARKLELTWCVGRVFPTSAGMEEVNAEHYEQIVRHMERATRAWERAADVNFVHLREYDSPQSWGSGDCRPGENGIYFRVRMDEGCRGPCMGLTNSTPDTEFAPEWASPQNPDGLVREFIIGFVPAQSSEYEAGVTTLHELGHILGFAHEHEQFMQADEQCADGPLPWRELAPPDPSSVMGYDYCEGILHNQTRLSAYDRLSGYLQYTWGHRRVKMMGPVSLLSDYSYDGSGRTGIAWYTPKSNQLDLWTSTSAPGEAIEFEASVRCLDGGPGPACNGDFDADGRSRPIPLFGRGDDIDLDVLFYGPGQQLDDVLAFNDGALLDPWVIPDGAYAIPIIGSFGNGVNDQMLLYQPGPGDDVLLSLDADGVTVSPAPISDYAIPLAGRYQGFGGGGNNIIWYSPQSNSLRVWWWSNWDEFAYDDFGVVSLAELGLEPDIEYVPLLGDFNGDGLTDIFWYAPGPDPDQLWISTSNEQYLVFEAFEHQVEGEYKPLVGDFDADGIDDIFW